ncbi:Protein of unknown function [Pyronema omphalodes CBS 100304]|uniref:Uncharacterized protein n=1 Tax=Pyronema omphalodes (strain CBS 100304) TaxID=1076935 RepID=U4LHV8_PYROM|nr:Protein of unknown function [Pyronema omphalodes CBS 100304]
MKMSCSVHTKRRTSSWHHHLATLDTRKLKSDSPTRYRKVMVCSLLSRHCTKLILQKHLLILTRKHKHSRRYLQTEDFRSCCRLIG